MAKIESLNVKKTFKIKKDGNQYDELPALGGVDLKIDQGEFMVIVGPSGCGKSTFLDLVSGLTLPDEGTISIDNKPVTGPGLDRAIVFQQNALFPWRNTLENVEFGLESINPDKDNRREIALDYLSLVGLSGYHNHYPHQLSGGMKQRVCIARALLCNPALVLADEPPTNLDVTIQAQILDLLKELKERFHMAMILVTHDMGVVARMADRIVVMYAGRIC